MRTISVIIVAIGLLAYDHLLENGPMWAIICLPVGVIIILIIFNLKNHGNTNN